MKLIKNVYVWLFLSPILINYVIMSWRAPGVNGDTNAWIGFWGSYLGLIGAITIAIYSFQKQKEKEDNQDRKNNRSYIQVHDFTAPLRLTNVNTNENSRIIDTPGYSDLISRIKDSEQQSINTSFLKLAHFGNPDAIFDCKIQIDISYEEEKKYDINVNIGVFEKGIEIFVPLVPPGIEAGATIDLNNVSIEYNTLKNERLKLVHDVQRAKDTLLLLHDNDEPEVLYEFNMKGSTWIYPNKKKM
ncbi:hypothetical protein FB479_101569 [Brevibacillus sp. AG162]|uniref:hypothetical protein n=1 Tax=Brevibacillus sp. AG162 TaxID=2572910 RepID=UPI0011522169|nr:hypothetical protein [Brevibacillus sp. AG162]TQK74958.1 hypothetical protein FB479_101569 [Brevibacillus sp. AG162]